jgi:hypothetical protein
MNADDAEKDMAEISEADASYIETIERLIAMLSSYKSGLMCSSAEERKAADVAVMASLQLQIGLMQMQVNFSSLDALAPPSDPEWPSEISEQGT